MLFVVEKADAALDGGSIFLIIRDRDGVQHRVELVQSMFLGSREPAHLPGRLYLDGELVVVRSEQERMLLDGLKEAMSASTAVPGGQEFVGELLRFVESERYVALAQNDGHHK